MRSSRLRPAGDFKSQLAPWLMLALCLGLSQKTLLAQATQLSPKSFAVSYSIVVIGSSRPAFDSLLQRDFPGASQVEYFQTVKPLLAIVANNSERVVKAFVIKWAVTSATGVTSTAYLPVFSPPSAGDPRLVGSVTVLGRGGTGLGTELVSPYFNWSEREFPGTLNINAVMGGFQAASAKPLVSEVQNATGIQASLDGAIFGDGTFVGPDTWGLYERFQAEQKAELDEANWVLGQLNSGLTDQQLREQLSAQIYEGRNATGTDSANLYTAALGEAAGRALSVLNSDGEAALKQTSLLRAHEKPLALRRDAGR